MQRIAIDDGEFFQLTLSYGIADYGARGVDQRRHRRRDGNLLADSGSGHREVDRKGAAGGGCDLPALFVLETSGAGFELVVAGRADGDSKASFGVGHSGAPDGSSDVDCYDFSGGDYGAGGIADHSLENDVIQIIRDCIRRDEEHQC